MPSGYTAKDNGNNADIYKGGEKIGEVRDSRYFIYNVSNKSSVDAMVKAGAAMGMREDWARRAIEETLKTGIGTSVNHVRVYSLGDNEVGVAKL